MNKDRIVFFASGDFAIDTFEIMINNGSNIVGLVTSNDKVKFHKETIGQIAYGLNIPTYIVKNNNLEEDEFLYDWLKRINADIFCVISFKKLPNNIIKLAKKCAFNVHASLLPFLRGAAPINWAIRLGYKETGLTAFVLTDKIDCGPILGNVKTKIKKGEKYTDLFKRLSALCVDFTDFIINDVLQREKWDKYINLVEQPNPNCLYDNLTIAHKINDKYFDESYWELMNAEEFKHYVDSVDDIGLPCNIEVTNEKGDVKVFNAKIYDVEILKVVVKQEDGNALVDNSPQTISDGKTFIRLGLAEGTAVYIKKIQLVGKKVMDVETFLNGFRYFREGNNHVYITDKIIEL